MVASKYTFQYLHLMTMNQGGKVYYQIRLVQKLGRKTIGCGSDHQRAMNIAYDVDAEIIRQVNLGGEVDLDSLRAIVKSAMELAVARKQGNLRLVEKDDLRVLWRQYCDWHESMGAWKQTTILTRNATVGALVERCPYQRLEQKREIVLWLLEDKSRTVKTSRDRFKTITSCVEWCSKQDIVPRRWGQEYKDLLSTINIKGHIANNLDADGEVDIFRVAEVYTIINALRSDEYSRFKGKHSQYWRYVAFLWLTGCRPCEAIALKWGNVDLSKNSINFREAHVEVSGRVIKQKGTKTVKNRVFPVNAELYELLESMPGKRNSSDHVFTNDKGLPISQNSLRDVWRKLLDDLNIRYRVPYQLRHTMISYHANNDYPLQKLASVVGNSEDIISEHYLRLDIERISLPSIIK